MKYIILRYPANKEKTVFIDAPIIFPNGILHSEMYHATCRLYGRETDVIAAGHVGLGSVFCNGESESLGIKSRKKDAELIMSFDDKVRP